MTPQRWYVIATMMMLAVVPTFATANRVANGDFEAAGDDSCQIPSWRDDHAEEGRLCRTHRVDLVGADNTAGLVIAGPETRRSCDTFVPPDFLEECGRFLVTAGETLTFEADIQVLLGDATAALVIRDVTGAAICGSTIGPGYGVDNFVPDLGFVHYASAPLVVCAGGVYGEVLLGGSYLIDPVFVVSAPLGVSVFDNVFVDTAP